MPRLGLGLAQIREGRARGGHHGDRDGGEPRPRASAGAQLPRQGLLRSEARPPRRRGSSTWRRQRTPRTRPRCSTTPSPSRPRNEPVEALKDLQEAIELNDNRGVYRSRLAARPDLAARSASLGRIYSDLGFQDLALVEGWSSVNTDPSNYSAHRLLADSYAALPRHEIARVSELFQSQMLQPLNTTPIQPRLGESNLFLISSQGPGALAFNEFNPLFNRNQVNAQGSFLAGEDTTLTGEGIVSGIFDKFSFSAGYSGFKTDGFRENATQDDKIANAFAQVAAEPEHEPPGRGAAPQGGERGHRSALQRRRFQHRCKPRPWTAPTIASGCATTSAPRSPSSGPTCTRTRTSTSPCPTPWRASTSASRATRRRTAPKGRCSSAPGASRRWRAPATSTSGRERRTPSTSPSKASPPSPTSTPRSSTPTCTCTRTSRSCPT